MIAKTINNNKRSVLKTDRFEQSIIIDWGMAAVKFFTDQNRSIAVVQVASANTFVSSVANSITRYILSAFPKHYFRSIYMDTSDTFVEKNMVDAYNASLPKKVYPNLSITPAITMDDSPFNKMYYVSSPNEWLPKEMLSNYTMLLDDPNGKIRLYFSNDYITVRMQFTAKVNTFSQCTDIGYWIKSRFDDKMNKFLDNQIINIEVPPAIINVVAGVNGWFLPGQTDAAAQKDMENLEIYLEQTARTKGRLHRATSMTTGKNSFYFGNKVNILTTFENLTVPESIIRNNKTEGEYSITFSVSASAWHPNAFVMSVLPDSNSSDTVSTAFTDTESTDTGFATYTLYGAFPLNKEITNTFLDAKLNKHIGQNIVHQIYTFPVNTTISSIFVSKLLKPDLVKLLTYARDMTNIDLSSVINFKATGFSQYEKVDGVADYDSLSIVFPNSVDSDLAVDVYIDRASVDSLAKGLLGDPFFSQPQAISVIRLGYVDTDGKAYEKLAKVYAFSGTTDAEKLADMQKDDIEKSLRVMTASGEIGYIGLVPEGDKNASDFKIFLGKNRYGTNIIRCFELV